MSLHPDIAALLEMIQLGTETGARIPFPQLTPEQARADFDASSPLLDVDPSPLAHEKQLRLPMRDGVEMAARLYADRPLNCAEPLPVLLYMHGGGFVVGSLDSHQPLCRGLAVDSGAAVLSIGYRLAPEHRFPIAFEDCVDALAWIGREGPANGLDRQRVAVGGDSAGGTLAAALAIAARDDRTLPQPLLQVLAYPGLSPQQTSDSYTTFGSGFLLERETVEWFFNHYLRDDADRQDWRFAPLTAPDLAGVAPAMLLLPEFDPLISEGRDYAARLRAAGVAVDQRIYPGMIHEFLRMGNVVPDALRARAEIGARLAEIFTQQSGVGR
ncbi:putative lipase/esterase [Bradyrhizobium sp. ORS 375]|uniref:alpha/beta hydrolase n=1 Tax=Bradyrhizobium sp. (strain ORS 375) TaxID=566679 RepID=UPI0002406F37|nr:alpha/beta hydrolase [Bradyrhizobium sp. ORS 375]CCD94887.1 putative lipase/esterase [Bradyrhizobium sp. ORS 375]